MQYADKLHPFAGDSDFNQGMNGARSSATAVSLSVLPPKLFELLLAQFRIAGGVLNGSMAEPVLNCPCVVACIGQRVAAGVPQHVLGSADLRYRRLWSPSLRLENFPARLCSSLEAWAVEFHLADRVRGCGWHGGRAAWRVSAMAASGTERLWEIGDIVDVLEAWEAAGGAGRMIKCGAMMVLVAVLSSFAERG